MPAKTDPPCEQCPGACCRAYPHLQDGASLTQEEAALPLFREHLRRDATGPFLSFKKSGKCPFLDSSTFRCRIYADRPEKCQTFSCLGSRKENPMVQQYPVMLGWIQPPPQPAN